MPDLHGWILEQIAYREEASRAASRGPWTFEIHRDRHTTEAWGFEVHPVAELEGNGDGGVTSEADAQHIALNGPDVALRRLAADRKLLTVHGPRGADWNSSERERYDPYVCVGCGQEGICQDWVTEHANDCPVLLAVAEGYGLTEEILADLDRPQWTPPPSAGQSALGKAIAEAWGATLKASLRASLKQDLALSTEAAPTPAEEALHILGPTLATIPLYQPGETGVERPTR